MRACENHELKWCSGHIPTGFDGYIFDNDQLSVIGSQIEVYQDENT